MEVLSREAKPEIWTMYEKLMSKIRDEAAKAAGKGISTDAVVRAVEHAITSRNPKTRYVIGRDARVWLLLNMLPDSWRDLLIMSELSK